MGTTYGNEPTTTERLSGNTDQDNQQSGQSPADESNESAKPESSKLIPLMPSGLAGAGQSMLNQGTNTLITNPELTKMWISTESAWTGKSGFTEGARTMLENAGMEVLNEANEPAPNSLNKNSGVSSGRAAGINGDLARDAIVDEYRAQGFAVRPEQGVDSDFNAIDRAPNELGDRAVDVVVERPHPTDPRLNAEHHIESKAHRVNAGESHIKPSQLNHDSGMLANNKMIRSTGFALERAGNVIRPIGLVTDGANVVGAVIKDSGIGVETGRTVTGIAGGAAGGFALAAKGAAIGGAMGTAVPIVGNVAGAIAGGVVGGIIGAWGGETIAKGAFDTVRGWFN